MEMTYRQNIFHRLLQNEWPYKVLEKGKTKIIHVDLKVIGVVGVVGFNVSNGDHANAILLLKRNIAVLGSLVLGE